MYYNKFLLLILMLQYSGAESERDLFLTPKEDLQIIGRTLFYNPETFVINGTVPWEETLKHVTYLSLFTENDSRGNLSDLREYQDFMHAPYEKSHEEYSRFGDIITMARGWVEKSDDYSFKEGPCESVCLENALAIWRVQKIRHRDPLRGFRYEMKFSVTPLDTKTPVNEEYIKSFIMKDEEYPKNFNKLDRRSDSFEEDFSNEREARIVNHSPRQDFTNFPPLNIGELLQVPKASPKVGYLSSSRNDLPTTYRPNYRVKYTKPEVYEAPQEDPKTVVTHHFHHHYFMNDAEISKDPVPKFYHGNADAIRIIEPPSIDHLLPRYVLTTTTEAPAIQQVFYKHQQRPLYVQPFSHLETTTRPFIQSEQQFEEFHYSEPDPLYENVDGIHNETLSNYRHSDESTSYEIYPQVERPGAEAHNSLIEQLPQSAEEQGTHLSYVEAHQETTTTIKPTTLAYQSTRRTLLPKNKFFVTLSPTTTSTRAPTTTTTTTTSTTSSESPIRYATKLSPKVRNYNRTTTEQPILKWKPKRNPKQKEEKVDNSAKLEKEKVITVTPSKDEVEILTHKSVSKSVSVRVGNHSQEIPVILETTTLSSEDEEGSSEIGVNED